MNLTIKEIPEEVYKSLKQEAAAEGRSLNQEVLLVLGARAEEIERRRAMRASRDELETFVTGLPELSSSVPLIHRDQAGH